MFLEVDTAVEAEVIVQDNLRELGQADLFHLTPLPGRLGADAVDEIGNRFEFKTTTKKSGGVSTARDLGPNKLTEWSGYYWIISRGKNTKSGFTANQHYFLAPQHMAGWYAKIQIGFDVDTALALKVMQFAEPHLSEAEATRARRLLHRGMLLNDPTIPWSYITSHGIEISENHAATLRNLVEAFPIERT